MFSHYNNAGEDASWRGSEGPVFWLLRASTETKTR